jgi:hypothetical protein
MEILLSNDLSSKGILLYNCGIERATSEASPKPKILIGLAGFFASQLVSEPDGTSSSLA